uniref:G patch domain-containing protein 2-like isoform X1 n=1 Tax=Petromyzon marinus TaxID=7757 RepID=A0AAJ7X4L3_PETMA|nr:G patch domain-containing protein 2-like isoform X1 [Petromyzon marinus]XP_032821071.1 G patch domain-containing protein 2-like isoform X1 [Petromyzon marinus]XP_032821072.1 G patch domain-containing protein 2-like isoform X1 [Petromyzon marinus]XP_032821074.1 G patch domain-containing protein 2-like isoform X1 [Petromyzon marinus]XP_032821075.1 G patch domain-containing protein 2-like isoform X1 [Petromyzon marinus]
MDELVHDLASALEETSAQNKARAAAAAEEEQEPEQEEDDEEDDEERAVAVEWGRLPPPAPAPPPPPLPPPPPGGALSPRQLRRQARKRRGRKRRGEHALNLAPALLARPPASATAAARGYLSEGSESSQEEGTLGKSGPANVAVVGAGAAIDVAAACGGPVPAATAGNSDSDEALCARRLRLASASSSSSLNAVALRPCGAVAAPLGPPTSAPPGSTVTVVAAVSPVLVSPTLVPARHSWHESDSFPESGPGRTTRRRRKVKRMAVDPPAVSTPTTRGGVATATANEPPLCSHPPFCPPVASAGRGYMGPGLLLGMAAWRHHKKLRLARGGGSGGGGGGGGSSRGAVGVEWGARGPPGAGAEGTDEGVVVETGEDAELGGAMREAAGASGGRDGMDCEEDDGNKNSDDNMSDGDTSSLGSSDAGLYTNDEGRQADDEQSDWFGETDREVGPGVGAVPPWWQRPRELHAQPAHRDAGDPVLHSLLAGGFPLLSRTGHRGFHARLSRLPGVAARSIRKGRRRLPGKLSGIGGVGGDRMAHHSMDVHPRECWPYPLGRKDRNQQLSHIGALYSLDVRGDAIHNSRQVSVTLGALCAEDVKRRRKVAPSAFVSENAHAGLDGGAGGRTLQGMSWIPSPAPGADASGGGPTGGRSDPVGATQRPKGAGVGYNLS